MTPTERASMDRLIARVRAELELKNNAHVPNARLMLVLSATAWRLLQRAGKTDAFDGYGVRKVVERDGAKAFEVLTLAACEKGASDAH